MDSPINLKRVLRDRMESAEGPGMAASAPVTPPPSGISFTAGRKLTPAEQAQRAKALAEILRRRGY